MQGYITKWECLLKMTLKMRRRRRRRENNKNEEGEEGKQ